MPGRNDRCPCGSGRKYKKCCLQKTPRAAVASNAVPTIAPVISSPSLTKVNRGEGKISKQLKGVRLTALTVVRRPPSPWEDRLHPARRASLPSCLVDWKSVVNLKYTEKPRMRGDQAFKQLRLRQLDRMLDLLPRALVHAQRSRWHESDIANSMIYHFSDSTEITAADLLFSPYCCLVPPDLRPLNSSLPLDVPLWRDQFPTTWEGVDSQFEYPTPKDQGRAFGILEWARALARIIDIALNPIRSNELDLYFAFDEGAQRRCLRIADIKAKPNLEVELSFHHDAGENMRTQIRARPPLGSVVFSDGLYDTATKSFASFRFEAAMRRLEVWIDGVDSSEIKQTDPETILLAEADGIEGARELVEIAQKYGVSGLEVRLPNLPLQIAFPKININNDGRFSLQYGLGSASAEVTFFGFTPAGLNLVRLQLEGLSSFFKEEVRDMASRTYRYRDLELKLFKHQGVTNYILFETLHSALRGQTSENIPVRNPAQLLKAIETRIMALLGLPRESFRENCSRSCLKRYETLIREVMGCLTVDGMYWLPDGKVKIRDLIRCEFQVLLEVLEFAALSTKGAVFSKARSAGMEALLTADARLRNLRLQMVTRSETDTDIKATLGLPIIGPGSGLKSLEALSRLTLAGIDIRISGRPLTELSEKDLKTELRLAGG